MIPIAVSVATFASEASGASSPSAALPTGPAISSPRRRGSGRSARERDFWPYGYAPNIDTIDRLLRYHHEQGLSRRRLTPQEIFAPETFESFKI